MFMVAVICRVNKSYSRTALAATSVRPSGANVRGVVAELTAAQTTTVRGSQQSLTIC